MSSAFALSEKDKATLSKARRMFERKLNKQALKGCEEILRKKDNHGQTLALKGAILGRTAESDAQKKEAMDWCRKGVALDVDCKDSWNLMGQMQKDFRQYNEAIRTFKQLIKKSENLNEKTVYRRELAWMAAQVRNWPDAIDARKTMMLENPGQYSAWLGYFMAAYFAGNYEMALSLLRDFRKDRVDRKVLDDTLQSEIDLFLVRILEESGKTDEALDVVANLEKCGNALARNEAWGRLELKTGAFDAAKGRYFDLVKSRNAENYDWHRGLQCAISKDASSYKTSGIELPITANSAPETITAVTDVYNQLAEALPKSMACQRIPLDFVSEVEFATRGEQFMRAYLKKKVPCLFSVLKTLYTSRSELARRAFGSVVEARIKELEIPSDDVDVKAELAFAYYFLAQHLDKIEPGSDAALNTADKAIAADPVVPDFSRFKARIVKHAGDFEAAADLVDKARQMELNDRWLNNKAAKYALRANRQDAALALTHLFTRGEDMESVPDPASLHEYQCMWYEIESGNAAYRSGDVVFALKNYRWIETHFETIKEDEYDFHEYCLRKMTFGAYADIVARDDRMNATPAFKTSARGAIQCWIDVFDIDAGANALKDYQKKKAHEQRALDAESDESQFAGLTPTEKKKAKAKLRKEKLEKEQAEIAKKLEAAKKLTTASAPIAAAPASATANSAEKDEDDEDEDAPAPAVEEKADLATSMSGNQKPLRKKRTDVATDKDPRGFERFASLCKNPLAEAQRLVDVLVDAKNNDVGDLVIAFDVAVRRKEVAKAWTFLERASKASSWTAPQVLERFVPLARFSALGSSTAWRGAQGGASGPFAVDQAVKDAIAKVCASAFPKPPVEFAIEALKSSDANTILSAARGLVAADTEKPKALAALGLIIKPLNACISAANVLKVTKGAEEIVITHKADAARAWPRDKRFK